MAAPSCNPGFGEFTSTPGVRGEEIPINKIKYSALLQALDITESNETLKPSQEYKTPSHIMQLVREHDFLRDCTFQILNYSTDPEDTVGDRYWKLNTILRLCKAAERLEIEGRGMNNQPLPLSERLKLPRPLHDAHCISVYLGIEHEKKPRLIRTNIDKALMLKERPWQIGLAITLRRAEFGGWDPRDCLAQMKAVYLARRRRNNEKDIGVYGIMTSGEIVQFYKLNEGKEVQSSPPLLFTEEGLPRIWSYLRDIIHHIQLDAAPCGDRFRSRPLWVREKKVLIQRWGCDPAGNGPKPYVGLSPEIGMETYEAPRIREIEDIKDLDSSDDDSSDVGLLWF